MFAQAACRVGHQCGGGIYDTTKQKGRQQSTVCIFSLYGGMTVGTKGCIHTSICVPHACAVMPCGGEVIELQLAWDGAVMMPLQEIIYLWKKPIFICSISNPQYMYFLFFKFCFQHLVIYQRQETSSHNWLVHVIPHACLYKCILLWLSSEAQFIVPDWEDNVDHCVGLSYRSVWLYRLAGRYDNPMPQSTVSPSKGL